MNSCTSQKRQTHTLTIDGHQTTNSKICLPQSKTFQCKYKRLILFMVIATNAKQKKTSRLIETIWMATASVSPLNSTSLWLEYSFVQTSYVGIQFKQQEKMSHKSSHPIKSNWNETSDGKKKKPSSQKSHDSTLATYIRFGDYIQPDQLSIYTVGVAHSLMCFSIFNFVWQSNANCGSYRSYFMQYRALESVNCKL